MLLPRLRDDRSIHHSAAAGTKPDRSPRKEDFTWNGETYDLIFDADGKASPSRSKRSLTENGVVVSVRSTTRENLILLKDLVEQGKIKPNIDRYYPLEQTADAHRYVETGRKKGNVVITAAN